MQTLQTLSLPHILLNIIFTSIPEEAFIAIITLIFLKLNNLLDIYMWNKSLKWIALAVLPVSIMINILKYIIIVPQQNMMISTMIIMILLMEFIVINNSYDINILLIIKTAIFTISGFVIVGLVEYSYCPLILSLLDRPISFFNANVFYNFLLGLPARVLYLCVISFVIIRRNSTVHIDLFNSIVKNKFFIYGFLLMVLVRISLVSYVVKLIERNNILIYIQFVEKLYIIIGIICIPIIFITLLLMFVNNLLCKEQIKLQVYESMINSNGINGY